MVVMKYLSVCLIGCLLVVDGALAQTPEIPMWAGVTTTITYPDVAARMSPAERQEFETMSRTMKQYDEGIERLGQLAEADPELAGTLRTLKDNLDNERNEKFRAFRGLSNQTITVYGCPFPSKAEILNVVINARKNGGDGTLYPYWVRPETTIVGPLGPYETGSCGDGNPIVGSSDPASTLRYGPAPYPAGDAVQAQTRYDGSQDRPVNDVTSEQDAPQYDDLNVFGF
jgi:hypothetical protein